MVKMISRVGSGTRRCIVVAAMTTALVGCGGGSGDADTTAEPTVDLNGDGVIDVLDTDADGDEIADVDDDFVDTDFDGFDDRTGLTETEATASTVPGDEDNDGFTDVSEANQCGSESGTDNDSSTATWDDNCVIKRTAIGGQFADSLYSVGIQRVLACTGLYSGVIDGEYGPGSETSLKTFQRAEALVDDGIVGAQTWGRLQEKVTVLTPGQVGSTPDTMGFADGTCAGTPMFYQYTTAAEDGLSIVRGRWELAKNPPEADQRLPFSIGSPFADF